MADILGFVFLFILLSAALAWVPRGSGFARRVLRWWGRQARGAVEFIGRGTGRLFLRYPLAGGIVLILLAIALAAR